MIGKKGFLQSEKCFLKGLSNVPVVDRNLKRKIRICGCILQLELRWMGLQERRVYHYFKSNISTTETTGYKFVTTFLKKTR